MRLLSIDIETSPNLAYVWQLYGSGKLSITNDKLVEPTEMMCFAAKWIGQNEEPFFYSTYHDGSYNMVEAAWSLLDQADATVTYNGDHFDDPRLNREFVTFGFKPPSPYKRIDLYKVVRKRFAFPSSKLDYVCQELGLGRKVKNSGFDLWKRCLADDPDAWAEMREYNKQDAVLNEELYFELRPWIPSLPSYGAETGEDVCPACGSAELRREGHAYTKTGRYQRYQCTQCDTWSRATRRDQGTQITQVTA